MNRKGTKVKGSLCGVMAVLVALGLVMAAPSGRVARAATLFDDDFESYTIDTFPSANWTDVTGLGDWTVQSDGSKVLDQSDTSQSQFVVVAGNGSWTDYAYQAKVKISTAASSRWTGLLGRYVNLDNFYVMWLDGGSTLTLEKRVNGSFSVLQSVSYSYSANTWYTLRLEFDGSNIKGYVNGVKKIDVNDGAHSAGKVGFRGHTAFECDDALVTDQ